MKKIEKLLRSLVPQEVAALLEKIDATDSTSDSSYRSASALVRDGNFNWLERKLLKNAISKISRRETLGWAMNVVVFNNINGEIIQPDKWGHTTTTINNGGTGNTIRSAFNQGLLNSAQQSQANVRVAQGMMNSAQSQYQGYYPREYGSSL